MDLCNQSCSFGRLAVLRGNSLNIEYYAKPFQPIVFSFILPMLRGIIDWSYFVVRSENWEMGRGRELERDKDRRTERAITVKYLVSAHPPPSPPLSTNFLEK